MSKEEEEYWLGMKLVEGLDSRFLRLIELFGSARNVWKASLQDLVDHANIEQEKARTIIEQRERLDLDAITAELRDASISLLTLKDKAYPPLLREIHHPPPMLFVKGQRLFDYGIAVAIVGSRSCTYEGMRLAEELAEGLSSVGITIVSGLARGIDSASHQGALRGSGKTIAVIGNGIDVIYPPENSGLFKKICLEGAVVSEYPPGTQPLPMNFPRRNRIISGLSSGTVVVEAKEKSGALITARFALEQNRDVMAVPGSVRSIRSKGTNKLLKAGAFLVENTEDVLDCLGLVQSGASNIDNREDGLSEAEKAVIRSADDGLNRFDQLLQSTKLSIGELASVLTTLELKGFIERTPGESYMIKRSVNMHYDPDEQQV